MQQQLESHEVCERQIYSLTSEQLDFYWPQIADSLKEVPGFYDYYTPEWAYQAAKMGQIQIWALSDGSIRGLVVTKIAIYPKQKVLEIMALAGNSCLAYEDEMEGVFERLARQCGCSTIAALVRPGLVKLATRKGATQTAVLLSKFVSLEKDQ